MRNVISMGSKSNVPTVTTIDGIRLPAARLPLPSTSIAITTEEMLTYGLLLIDHPHQNPCSANKNVRHAIAVSHTRV